MSTPDLHSDQMKPTASRARSEQLTLPVNELRALVDVLDQIDCHSYTLHATDSTYYSARNPATAEGSRISLRLTIIGRTQFEQVCARLSAKATERVFLPGQRAWWAEADTQNRRLLIEGVSFQHHDDWEPRP